jgi:hypothetical protein
MKFIRTKIGSREIYVNASAIAYVDQNDHGSANVYFSARSKEGAGLASIHLEREEALRFIAALDVTPS